MYIGENADYTAYSMLNILGVEINVREVDVLHQGGTLDGETSVSGNVCESRGKKIFYELSTLLCTISVQSHDNPGSMRRRTLDDLKIDSKRCYNSQVIPQHC